jgi:membrane fusion protein, copper/silver efflux system
MKNNFKFISFLRGILILVFLVACEQNKSPHEGHENMKKDSTKHLHENRTMYHCPMHPEITSDKPGTCPKCGMDLELIPQKEQLDTMASLIQPTNHTVVSTLKPITPISKGLTRRIEAMGYLTYNPDYASSISARVSGRIEKLYVRHNFQGVNKGEKLLEIYSPELLTAQNEYLYLFRTNNLADNTSSQASKLKLINLGMNEEAIALMEKNNKVNPFIPIYASGSGHVHFLTDNADMSAHALSWPGSVASSSMGNSGNMTASSEVLRKGDYVKKGDLLFVIANESGIWALFKILPSDIPYIQKGDAVEININETIHEGKVNFIEKSFDAGSDFYTVRVYLNCDDHSDLQIGTLIRGYISVQNKKQETMWVPAKSVLSLGKAKSVVFIKKGDAYQARAISAGEYVNEWIEVMNGLSIKDSIAPVASYLVDSEAFIITEEQ